MKRVMHKKHPVLVALAAAIFGSVIVFTALYYFAPGALSVSNTPLSVVVILGIILLGGIVVNNGIILIDYINQLRGTGTPMLEAVIQAGRTRLRPILMTAFSSAIGLAPLAFGIGQGNALQAPMAVTVMGGILVATFLTLVVTPALYIGTEEFANRFRKK